MGRRIVLEAPRRSRLESDVTPAAPGPGEARVAVAAAGLCGSDRELYEGTRPPEYTRYPVTPGHEWSGTVTAVGPGVDPSLTGRKVVGEGFRGCQRCRHCRDGATPLCDRGYDETGFTCPGAFADTLVLPARLLHLLPDDADLEAAALLEPAAVAAGATVAAGPVAGERVAVVGAGTLGLLAAQLLAAAEPRELLAIDPRSDARQRARAAGATVTAAPGEAPAGEWDLVLETAGAPGSAADSLALARRGGRVVLTGIPAPGARPLDPADLVVRALTVRTVFGAGAAAWSHAVRAFAAGVLNPAPLITHRLPLEEYPRAALLAGNGEGETPTGKVLLVP